MTTASVRSGTDVARFRTWTPELPGSSGSRLAGDPDPAWPSQYGCMRVRIIAVTAACVAVVGVSGCARPSETCAVKDYDGGGTSGYQTPQQALQ
jgi:hypothetical protein